jgi:hypothetical protein
VGYAQSVHKLLPPVPSIWESAAVLIDRTGEAGV